MSWHGQYYGFYFGGWFGALVEYASRVKRGFSYVVTEVQSLFVSVKRSETTVKKRG